MGCSRNRELTQDGAVSSSSSSSLSDALLFATMCIIGLPVDVHVKDCSVYSGIFHTASVENQYGIVLKNARMTKKGKTDANVANGELIDTLVILSADLVQVVTKGVLLPADGVAGNMSGDRVEVVSGTVSSKECSKNVAKKSVESATNKKKGGRALMQNGNGCPGVPPTRAGKEHGGRKLHVEHIENASEPEIKRSERVNLSEIREPSDASVNRRQVDDRSQGKQDDFNQKSEVHREESADKVQDTKKTCKLLPFGVSCDASTVIVQRDIQCSEQTTSQYTSSGSTVVSSGSSTLLNSAANISSRNSEITSAEMIHHGSELNKTAKDFKLNPGAKVFSPSLTKPMTVTSPALPTAASLGFRPTNCPVVPGPAVQPEVGSNPFPTSCTSVPVKVLPYNNFTTGNGGSALQFPQPIVGHISSRAHTVRYAGQYPVRAGPTYVHPNSQAVMVGRFGQLVYVHPVPQDLVQGTPAISPLSARPMLTPHQVQFPKHHGTAGQALQPCVPPQFMATGQQPFPIAKSHPIFATSLPF